MFVCVLVVACICITSLVSHFRVFHYFRVSELFLIPLSISILSFSRFLDAAVMAAAPLPDCAGGGGRSFLDVITIITIIIIIIIIINIGSSSSSSSSSSSIVTIIIMIINIGSSSSSSIVIIFIVLMSIIRLFVCFVACFGSISLNLCLTRFAGISPEFHQIETLECPSFVFMRVSSCQGAP